MRRLGLTLIATAAAVTLSGCGKPSTSSPAASSSSGQAAAPAAAPLSDAEKKAIQATYPAPYNTADLENGAAKFALCSSCHTLSEGGPVMTGPNLWHILGEKAGVREGYKFSDPMKAAGFTWDPAHLDTWITDPKVMIPGTKMTFAGLKDPKDRTDVIAYLMVQTGYKP
jgi:cytochrome c